MNSLFSLFDSFCAKILSEKAQKSGQTRFPSNDKKPDGNGPLSPQIKNKINLQKIGESSEPKNIETLALIVE